jgi:hypothetical protein
MRFSPWVKSVLLTPESRLVTPSLPAGLRALRTSADIPERRPIVVALLAFLEASRPQDS